MNGSRLLRRQQWDRQATGQAIPSTLTQEPTTVFADALTAAPLPSSWEEHEPWSLTINQSPPTIHGEPPLVTRPRSEVLVDGATNGSWAPYGQEREGSEQSDANTCGQRHSEASPCRIRSQARRELP